MSLHTIPYVNYEIPRDVNNIYYMFGYKFKYIPYLLAEDIANVMSHWKMTGKHGGYVGISTPFGLKYKKFLYSIPFDLYNESTPYKMAVAIIKSLSSKYDYRKIEKAIVNKDDSFDFVESNNEMNPDIDVDLLSEYEKELLDIDISDYIPLEIVRIIKATEKFNKLFSSNNTYEISKMRSYDKIKYLPKYKLALPMFNYKYPLKNYTIKQGDPKEIVVFRDISYSAKVLEPSFKALLLHFIKSYKGKTIIINEFTDHIVNTIRLNTINDLKIYYNKDTKYYISYLKFLPNFIKEYSECYIITSGVTDQYPKMLNCIINGITKGGNESLERLCNNTKGKYMII